MFCRNTLKKIIIYYCESYEIFIIFAHKQICLIFYYLKNNMLHVHSFTFNPFQENTYILYDQTKECIIIDPGCNNYNENTTLSSYITEMGLKPVRLINTHCHIDHVLGNDYVYRTYGLKPEFHRGEQPLLDSMDRVAKMYDLPMTPSPEALRYIEEGELIHFGYSVLETILTPGHSPASLCLYSAQNGICIAGDVLFYGSIGRTDLPGGDYDTLINSIEQKLMKLPDETIVYPGHGESTTIGYELKTNPFLQ